MVSEVRGRSERPAIAAINALTIHDLPDDILVDIFKMLMALLNAESCVSSQNIQMLMQCCIQFRSVTTRMLREVLELPSNASPRNVSYHLNLWLHQESVFRLQRSRNYYQQIAAAAEDSRPSVCPVGAHGCWHESPLLSYGAIALLWGAVYGMIAAGRHMQKAPVISVMVSVTGGIVGLVALYLSVRACAPVPSYWRQCRAWFLSRMFELHLAELNPGSLVVMVPADNGMTESGVASVANTHETLEAGLLVPAPSH